MDMFAGQSYDYWITSAIFICFITPLPPLQSIPTPSWSFSLWPLFGYWLLAPILMSKTGNIRLKLYLFNSQKGVQASLLIHPSTKKKTILPGHLQLTVWGFFSMSWCYSSHTNLFSCVRQEFSEFHSSHVYSCVTARYTHLLLVSTQAG